MALRLDQKTRLMSALPIFAALEPSAVHVLAFSAREQALGAGQILFHEGDASDGGFIVVSGRVALSSSSSAIGEETFGPGALIGEAALVVDTERPATARATEETQLLALPRQLVLQVLEGYPDSVVRLRQIVAQKLAATAALIDQVAID